MPPDMKTSQHVSASKAPTFIPGNGNGGGTDQTPDTLHALSVANLREAVDALLRGDFDAAQKAIQIRRDSSMRPVAPAAAPPVELETVAPEFVAAAADASVAWELYQDAWKRRQELLGAFLQRHGAGPVLYQGEPYFVVRRTRNGSTAVFLRRAR
jgi:hypothetical protein